MASLIAPCGMNCGICLGHLRVKNRCPGCRAQETGITYCRKCIIRNCGHFASGKNKFCFTCEKFPCRRLKQLDKRYRTRYNMSMLENLQKIRIEGIRKFTREEKVKWICPACGKTRCVHRKECIYCWSPFPLLTPGSRL